MALQNLAVILSKRPVGVPLPEHFELQERAVPAPGDGQVLVQTTHWSVDPAQRGWANDVPNYSPPVELGSPMRAFAVGDVLASRHPDFQEGDVVEGLLGWQSHALVDGTQITRKVTETDLPRSYALGVLGLNGTTAYFGLLSSCEAKRGDVVVVSTAAGAVGSAVGQIAKLQGCRTIGIAGGPEKVALCRDLFGYDVALDYKADDIEAGLAEAAPGGIDCYFDNTCGPISDAVMAHLAPGARITICGTAAITQWDPLPLGPRVHRQLLVARARMQGFLIFDYKERLGEARDALAGWLRADKLKVQEHILHGADHAPGAIEMLYRGANTGKLIIAL